MVTGVIFEKLQRKDLVKLTTLINASIRLKHVPNSWKITEIIMIPKPGKDHRKVESYRPIALLSIMSKLLEKLILKCLKKIIEKYYLVPTDQFGFRNNHSTLVHGDHITDIIEKALERKRICFAVAFIYHKPLAVSGSKGCYIN